MRRRPHTTTDGAGRHGAALTGRSGEGADGAGGHEIAAGLDAAQELQGLAAGEALADGAGAPAITAEHSQAGLGTLEPDGLRIKATGQAGLAGLEVETVAGETGCHGKREAKGRRTRRSVRENLTTRTAPPCRGGAERKGSGDAVGVWVELFQSLGHGGGDDQEQGDGQH